MADTTAIELVPFDESEERLERLVTAGFLACFKGNTRKLYALHLTQWGRWCMDVGLQKPLRAERPHIELWMRSLEERGNMSSTIAHKLSILNGWFQYAEDEGVIDRNPCARVRRPKVPRSSARKGFDRFELGALLAAASASKWPVDDALMSLLVLNGLRVSEACNALIQDLGSERGHRTLWVIRKGGAREKIALSPRTARALDRVVEDRVDGTILLTRAGTRMSRHAAARVVARLCKRAGIMDARCPHDVRHGAITALLDSGMSIRDVMHFAGHTDPRTTEWYDRQRHQLDKHATYVITAFLTGGNGGR